MSLFSSIYTPVRSLLALLPIILLSQSIQASPDLSMEQAPTALLANIQKGVAYSGFRSGQHPDRGEGAVLPSDKEILEDLQLILAEGFHLIRLYDSQENTQDVLRIIETNQLPIKVMLGIWLKGEISNHEGCEWVTSPVPQSKLDQNIEKNKKEVARGIELANKYPSIVAAINVGNESLVTWNDHLVSIESMITYLTQVREATQQPITTADNYEAFAQYGPQLADHLDFLAVHTYPLWEGKDIDDALPYSIENLQKVRTVIPNKPIVIAEAGWATIASEFPERASEEKQKRHFQELMTFGKENNITVLWFEAFDEDWKGHDDTPMGSEKHWGLYNIDRTPKQTLLSH